MRIILYLGALILVLFASCHTYEEGPKVSFRSIPNAMKGKWRIASYTVNGADSMWIINGLHLQGSFDFYSTFEGKGGFYVVTVEDTSHFHYKGSWGSGYGENETQLSFFDFRRQEVEQEFDTQVMPFKSTRWQIIRLKNNKDMWLKAEVDGKQYELKFKGIK